ncbi:uncharacterized protein LOC133517060 [Cydia pomonella]|uniref:uncharacterized protein LOC133517060 n=1 Tax=Cydia pomonella TaxID=82600 RepID=UPI002ADDACB8|nr:uncharacterized protein LOC133517060 [Cydia pomonella]
MLTSDARLICSAFLLLFLLEGHESWMGRYKDKSLLIDISRILVSDLVRKAETVWGLKDNFGKYKTFGIGEKVYLIRVKMAQMIRLSMRSQQKFSTRTTTQLIRNLTNLQRMCQELFLFMDELSKYDSEIMTQDKIRNVSRIAIGESCQAAGSMAIPPSVMDNYRRQLVDARRQHIVNTYLQKPLKPPIDVGKEMSESLNTKLRGPNIQHRDGDFMDLAPDIM